MPESDCVQGLPGEAVTLQLCRADVETTSGAFPSLSGVLSCKYGSLVTTAEEELAICPSGTYYFGNVMNKLFFFSPSQAIFSFTFY